MSGIEAPTRAVCARTATPADPHRDDGPMSFEPVVVHHDTWWPSLRVVDLSTRPIFDLPPMLDLERSSPEEQAS